MRKFAAVVSVGSLLVTTLFLNLAVAQGPVFSGSSGLSGGFGTDFSSGFSSGFGAGMREVVQDQERLLIRTDSTQFRLQNEVIVEIGAGKSVTAGAGEAAKPALCPPPTEGLTCGVVVPPPLPEPEPVIEAPSEPMRESMSDQKVEPTVESTTQPTVSVAQ
ncbi:MAG: hypothetical protein QE278_11740 [Limnobacter sp.]|nr:hypothetical protein [Limnobacter sp.]